MKFSNGKNGMEPWIETGMGHKFWYSTDDTDGIDIYDIASSLGKMCRFTGHCAYFYSVAEHSVNVSYLVPEEKALWGLLHDASEAYLADIASPVKQLLPEYKSLEARLMTRIARKFNLPDHFWLDPDVKLADWKQLKSEAAELLPSGGKEWFFPPNIGTGFNPLGSTHTIATYAFYQRFLELTNVRQEAA